MNVLVSNSRYFLAYAADQATRLHAYLKCSSMFSQEVWRGDRFTSALKKYFTDAELRKAKAERDAVNYVLRKYA